MTSSRHRCKIYVEIIKLHYSLIINHRTIIHDGRGFFKSCAPGNLISDGLRRNFLRAPRKILLNEVFYSELIFRIFRNSSRYGNLLLHIKKIHSKTVWRSAPDAYQNIVLRLRHITFIRVSGKNAYRVQ